MKKIRVPPWKPPTGITRVPQASPSSIPSSNKGGLAAEVALVDLRKDLQREYEEAKVALELAKQRFDLAHRRYFATLNEALNGRSSTSISEDVGEDEEEKDELEHDDFGY